MNLETTIQAWCNPETARKHGKTCGRPPGKGGGGSAPTGGGRKKAILKSLKQQRRELHPLIEKARRGQASEGEKKTLLDRLWRIAPVLQLIGVSLAAWLAFRPTRVIPAKVVGKLAREVPGVAKLARKVARKRPRRGISFRMR